MSRDLETFYLTGSFLLIAAAIGAAWMSQALVFAKARALEARVNLILEQMNITYPPPPSPGVREIARTRRITAIKAYREETGVGLKEAMGVIDRYIAEQEDGPRKFFP